MTSTNPLPPTYEAAKFKEIDRQKLLKWLKAGTPTLSANGQYSHLLIREEFLFRPQFLDQLKEYIYAAHKDAREQFKMEYLDPLGIQPENSTVKYPDSLPLKVLQGYFGEVIAGLVVENFTPFGIDDWIVPAYLFRFHNTIFEKLETMLQGGDVADTLPGRTGDDCLAFQFDNDGNVVRILYCEAKCSFDHNSSLINDAHEKVSKEVPSGIPEMIKILRDKKEPAARGLAESISTFRKKLHLKHITQDQRYDLVSYVHSRLPVRNESWISPNTPNSKYTASRRLVAVEIYIDTVLKLIEAVYDKK